MATTEWKSLHQMQASQDPQSRTGNSGAASAIVWTDVEHAAPKVVPPLLCRGSRRGPHFLHTSQFSTSERLHDPALKL